MESIVVELSHVSLTYHEPHAETLAIEDLSFQIREGEFVAIVGPSGCGKTSMLSLLCGLIQPSAGAVLLGGKSINAPRREGLSAGDAIPGRDGIPGEDIGYMLQRDHLLDWRDIAQNVMLGLEVKNLLNEAARSFCISVLRCMKRFSASCWARLWGR